MTIDWNHDLRDQLAFHWDYHFMPRLAGLTDEEYFREPVPGCWNVVRGEDGRWTVPWTFPEPDPPPFTTIGWRLVHIAIPILGVRASNHFGDGSYTFQAATVPGSADEALALLRENYRRWQEGIAALGAEGLARPCGPAEGPFADAPISALVLHIARETIHHAAEVCLLRDLYRAQDATHE